MRTIVDDLTALQRTGIRRAARLRGIATHCLEPRLTTAERENAVTYCVIELGNLWFGFSRALFLSSALAARDSTGVRVSVAAAPAPRTVDDALTYAIRRTRPRLKNSRPPWSWWHEPNWSKIGILLDAMDELGCSNRSQVAAAVSTQTLVFEHLVPARNFYAHRGKTARIALSPLVLAYSLPQTMRLSDALLQQARVGGVMRPQPLLLDWIDDMRNSIGLVA